MSGALACALMLKAVKLLVKQKDHEKDIQTLKELQTQLEVAQETFSALSRIDSEAYQEVSNTDKIQAQDEKQKQDTTEDSPLKATELPLKVMAHVVEYAPIQDKLLMYTSHSLLGDVQLATLLLNVAFESAKKNIIYNLKSISTNQQAILMQIKVEEMSQQWSYFFRSFNQKEKDAN